MIDKTMVQNKKMSSEKVEKKALKKYFFPDHALNIEAESREEAEKKLLDIINNK